MPRIEYNASAIAATQESILQQIAVIEELLKGRVDTDNVFDDASGNPELMSVYAVRDLPAPKRFVNNCMKYFADTSNFDEIWTNGVVDKLYDNAELTFLRASGSTSLTTTLVKDDPSKIRARKTVEVEKPTNYRVVKESRLHEILKRTTDNVNENIFHADSYINNRAGPREKKERMVTNIEMYAWSNLAEEDEREDVLNIRVPFSHTVRDGVDKISVEISMDIDMSVFGGESDERHIFVDYDVFFLCEVIR